VGSFASRITFFFSAENELLQKLAKYRAARRLWARLMKERFAARDPRSQPMRFQVQSGAQPHAPTANETRSRSVRR